MNAWKFLQRLFTVAADESAADNERLLVPEADPYPYHHAVAHGLQWKSGTEKKAETPGSP